MNEVSSPRTCPRMIGCAPRILLRFPRMLDCLVCLEWSPFLLLLRPGSVCLTSCLASSFLLVVCPLLILLIVLLLLSSLLSLLLPNRLVSLSVLWLVCLSRFLTGICFLSVHLPVGVLQACVFCLLVLLQFCCGGIRLICRGARCFYYIHWECVIWSILDINCFVQSVPLSLLFVICRKKVCLLWNCLDIHPSVKRLHPILSWLSAMCYVSHCGRHVPHFCELSCTSHSYILWDPVRYLGFCFIVLE